MLPIGGLDADLTVTFRQPFDLLADTTAQAAMVEGAEAADLAKKAIWLPFLDTDRTLVFVPGAELRQIFDGIREPRLAV